MHARDPIGDQIHLLLACGGLVCLFGPVTVTEIAFAPLLVFFVIRVVNTFPIWIHGFGQPMVLIILLLGAWMACSLSWSGDGAKGWAEISELRWFLVAGLLFPVIEKRIYLIISMCIGVAIAQLAQIADAFDGFGIAVLAELVENHEGRIAGWWHPVVGGTILVGALGMHLPAAIWGAGRLRLFGLAGSVTTGTGIVATGTRGALAAAIVLIVFTSIFAVVSKRARLKRMLPAILIGITLIGVSSWLMRSSISTRLDETRTEINAIMDGDYDSYSGLKVQMWSQAIQAIETKPLLGVGAGGYPSWVQEQSGRLVHDHAHNGLLHVWTTLGLVGVFIWAALIFVIARGAWNLRSSRSGSVYQIGPFFSIIGLLLASMTDTVQINTQTAAMLAVLASICLAVLPRSTAQTTGLSGKDQSSG
jgi:O-antigen ligase